MCCTLSEFVGCDITGQTLTNHLSDIISAYVDYLGVCGRDGGSCAGSVQRGHLCCRAIEWRDGGITEFERCQFGVGPDPEVLGAFGQGNLRDKGSFDCVNRQAGVCGSSGGGSGHNDGGGETSVDASQQFNDKGVVQEGPGSGDSVVGRSGMKLPRGPNYERNKVNRDGKKRRKQERRNGSVSVVPEQQGFWNSCKPETRELLIESKARMHAAENLRKAKEAEQKCQELDSPYNTMVKAVKMIEFAEKQAVKENDSKVYSWANSVATKSAESLARSTPNSVPSFAELEEKLAASSQSSFELDLARKDAEIESIKKDNDKLEMEVAELKLSGGKVEKKFGLNVPATLSNELAGVKTRRLGTKQREVGFNRVWPREDVEVFPEGFVPTPQQPWPHVRLTYADCHERNL